MIIVSESYSAEVDVAAIALLQARRKGMSRRVMKDMVDEICDLTPLQKRK